MISYYPNVTISNDAFEPTIEGKKAFIALLINGGVRGDFDKLWKEYKAQCPKKVTKRKRIK
jgi:hypothetical protein